MIASDIQRLVIDAVASAGRPDWMIVRRMCDSDDGDRWLKFSLFDDWHGRELPFGRHQGFITFVGASYKDVTTMLCDIYSHVKDDDMAVANLWILACRINMKAEDYLLGYIKQLMTESQRNRVFDILASSVVSEAYGGVGYYPETVDGWIRLQCACESCAHDFACSIATLVSDGRKIDMDLLFKLPACLISALIFYCGYRLSLTPAEACALAEPRRLALLCAMALHYSYDKFYEPEWLSQKFVDKMIIGDGATVGRSLLREAWMYSQQQTRFTLQQIRLMKYCRRAVVSILAAADDATRLWIDSLDIVKDMPVVLYLASAMAPKPEVPTILGNRVIATLGDEVAAFPKILAQRGGNSALTSLSLEARQSGVVFSMLGQSLASLGKDGLKDLTKTFYALKQLYAGGYHATQFAMSVTELLILAALMCGPQTDDREAVLLEIIRKADETVMTPYVHLAERTAAIWEPGYITSAHDLDKGKVIFNNLLRSALERQDGDPVKVRATALTNSIAATATTIWPYNRLFICNG